MPSFVDAPKGGVSFRMTTVAGAEEGNPCGAVDEYFMFCFV
jgi:hypothetical protein